MTFQNNNDVVPDGHVVPSAAWPPPFVPYGKTPRWRSQVIVTEKIDGTATERQRRGPGLHEPRGRHRGARSERLQAGQVRLREQGRPEPGGKVKLPLILALCGVTGCLSPAQRTTGLAMAAVTTLAIDWHQTRAITRNCNELNPIIGPCGERVSVDLYFPLVIAGTLVLAAALDRPWGDMVLAGVAGAEGATIWSNWANK